MKSGCATALVLNKWDLTSGDEFDLDHERARVARKLRLRPRVLTASAQDRAATSQRAARRGARRWPTARGTASRRPSSTASSPTSSPTPPAAAEAGPPAQAALHRADRRARRRASRSRSTPAPRHARLRVLRREPAARALRARGHPADHRLRRAQAAPQRAAGETAPPSGSDLALARRAARRDSPLWRRGARARRAGRRRAARRGGDTASTTPRRGSSPATRAGVRAPLDRRRRARVADAPGRLAGSLPLVAACATSASAADSRAGRSNFARDVRPWLGDEVALALLGPPARLRSCSPRRRRPREGGGARAARVGSLSARALPRRAGCPSLRLTTALAFVGDFLAVGTGGRPCAPAIDRDAGPRRARWPTRRPTASGHAGLPDEPRRSTPTPRADGRAHGCSRRAGGAARRCSARCSTGRG